MGLFYLNKRQTNDIDYEVHLDGCYWLTLVTDKEYLGNFVECSGAVAEAKRQHPTWYRINGCKHCSPACHTS
ncbi:hypothetical protein [uncultured Thioclava sp.]|uniref:hypothetical protein n=1 Tax=uncultured Thioclava sp. TaxID=473858 RepID=UPI0025E589D6|nr:hypothetical protein [uncultured Thioclava sp.]